MRTIVSVIVLLTLAACTVIPRLEMPVCYENCAPYGSASPVGRIGNREIAEASGLAASLRHQDVLWVNNDSGDDARLFALSPQGDTLGVVYFPQLRNVDWEDLTAFNWQGQAYLAIADTGDNFAVRRRPAVHIVTEPDLPSGSRGNHQVSWTVSFQYEDGARDCESVAVDVENERILLLTKRDVLPVLYEIPLRPEREVSVARRLVEVPMPQPAPELMRIDNRKGRYSAQPTAMDFTPDGSAAVVLTYRNAYFFGREVNMNWEQAFSQAPKVIPLPPMDTGEALAVDTTGQIFITAENHPAPMLRVKPK